MGSWDEMFSVEWNALDEMQIRLIKSVRIVVVGQLVRH